MRMSGGAIGPEQIRFRAKDAKGAKDSKAPFFHLVLSAILARVVLDDFLCSRLGTPALPPFQSTQGGVLLVDRRAESGRGFGP